MSRTPEIDALQRRIILFGVSVCRSLRQGPRDQVTRHISAQLIRSATAPAANYGEARAAESRRDFIHKMQICLKEFRETTVWLEFLAELGDGRQARTEIRKECGQLTAIFITSVRTARRLPPGETDSTPPAA
jgi:four helix bundle protein